jgi:hypothetical protein
VGRQRKTSDELERRGAFDKDPKRGLQRANEPVVNEDLGPPPAEFLKANSPTAVDMLACWNEILICAREVRLTRADRIHVEMTARQLYKCKRPGARSGDFGQLDRYLGKLGLNPADRSRVQGFGKTLEEEANEWDELADGKDGLSVQ